MDPRSTPANLALEPTVLTTTSTYGLSSLSVKEEIWLEMLFWRKSGNAFRENAESFPGGSGGSREAGDHALLAQERTSEYVPGQEQPEIRRSSQAKDEILWGRSKYNTKSLLKE